MPKRKRIKTAKTPLHRAEARLIGVMGKAMERSSWGGCRRTGTWLGLLFHYGLASRRAIAVSNLHLAFPAWSAKRAHWMARRVAQNACMTFCEFLHLKNASPEEVREYSWIEGYEHIEEGFTRGRGVILLTSHLGNWEVMGARAAQEFPLTVIARPRSNRAVHAHIEGIREHVGIKVISRFDTGRAPLRVLRSNQALGMLPDQYEQDGLLLPFFGRPTRSVDALARLAMLSGAVVVPGFGVRREPWLSDGRIVAHAFPSFIVENVEKGDNREAAVVEGTRRMLDELEKIITAHPDQWLWMHRRWRDEDRME